MKYVPYYMASTYGSGSYNSTTYNGSTTGTTPTPTPTTSGSGSTAGTTTGTSGSVLTNTGFDIVLGVSIASAIIFGAFVIKFFKKPASKSNSNLTN